VGHVPEPRVRLACRCGPCPSAPCHTGLSVWAMSQCPVSDWPVGVGHVPVPRVILACRCGPCPRAPCQTGLSVWAMSQHSSTRLLSAADQSSVTNATLSSHFADCFQGAAQLLCCAPGHILTIRQHFCVEC